MKRLLTVVLLTVCAAAPEGKFAVLPYCFLIPTCRHSSTLKSSDGPLGCEFEVHNNKILIEVRVKSSALTPN